MLRKLKYPILTANPFGMANILKPSHWDYLVAEGFIDGIYDDELIFDSSGHEYSIEAIELLDPPKLRSFFQLAGYFFMPPKRVGYSMAYINATLIRRQEHSIDSLKIRVREILAQNPHWRSGTSRPELETEIQRNISASHTPEELIRSFLYLDTSKADIGKEQSTKTIDSRSIIRSY